VNYTWFTEKLMLRGTLISNSNYETDFVVFGGGGGGKKKKNVFF
jgi:hypothetical protein